MWMVFLRRGMVRSAVDINLAKAGFRAEGRRRLEALPARNEGNALKQGRFSSRTCDINFRCMSELGAARGGQLSNVHAHSPRAPLACSGT